MPTGRSRMSEPRGEEVPRSTFQRPLRALWPTAHVKRWAPGEPYGEPERFVSPLQPELPWRCKTSSYFGAWYPTLPAFFIASAASSIDSNGVVR